MKNTTDNLRAVGSSRLVMPCPSLWLRIKAVAEYWVALSRLRWHQCPECNGDAPELYDCHVCGSWNAQPVYHEYPPSMERKAMWLARWHKARYDAWAMSVAEDGHNETSSATGGVNQH